MTANIYRFLADFPAGLIPLVAQQAVRHRLRLVLIIHGSLFKVELSCILFTGSAKRL